MVIMATGKPVRPRTWARGLRRWGNQPFGSYRQMHGAGAGYQLFATKGFRKAVRYNEAIESNEHAELLCNSKEDFRARWKWKWTVQASRASLALPILLSAFLTLIAIRQYRTIHIDTGIRDCENIEIFYAIFEGSLHDWSSVQISNDHASYWIIH